MHIRDFINSLSAKGQRCFTTAEIVATLGISFNAARSAIQHVKASGEIASPAKGFYVIVPPEYRILGCLPPELFIRQLMEYWKMPYYICLQSAAKYYGAAHQQTQVFHVMIPKNRPGIKCGKVRIDFIAKKGLERTPVQLFKTVAGNISVSTPEATAKDLICYPQRCGGFNPILTILEELVEAIKLVPLGELANSSHDKQWIQRLGFLLDLLERNEMSETLYQHIVECPIRYIPLAYYMPVEDAEKNNKWKINVNIELESDL